MATRFTDQARFWAERTLVRGAGYRLLFIALLIGLVTLLGGLIVLMFRAPFADAGDAFWWAFLRLTDPGYLGDDEGLVLRTVSTVLTVLGYVLFLGALIAIMTQWLNKTLRTLESGITPIAVRDHILILGWTNRTPTLVRELVLAEGRVRRFLRRQGARSLRIVILAEEVDAVLVQDLRDRLGELWDDSQVIFRSGTALRTEHLERVDFLNAAVIVVPGADFEQGGSAQVDTRMIKVLLSIANHPAARASRATLPLVVGEVFDARKIPVALAAYGAPLEILGSDAMISRLVAQNVRHRGLSRVYGELLTHGRGNEIYVRECPQFAGARLQDLVDCFANAVLLGVARPAGPSFRPLLNPPAGFVVEPGDRLVLLARSYADSGPAANARPAPAERAAEPAVYAARQKERRVLVLGWSHKTPALLREFDSYASERFHVDIFSTVAAEKRAARLQRYHLHAERISLRQLEGDFTVPGELARLDPAGYDNVVLLGSDWLDSGEESDARTILGYLLLRELLPDARRPDVLVELMDPGNVSLFDRRAGEVLISPLLISHMLAQIALRRELRAVFEELFGPGGAEIFFHRAAEYEVLGAELSFHDLRRAAARQGATALGVRLARDGGRVELNPPPGQRFTLEEDDELVVLTTY